MPANPRQRGEAERPCGLFRRLLTMLYDAIAVVALLLIAGAVALPITGDEHQALRDVPFSLYLLGLWFLYFGWCWRHGGQTVGMRAWKVRILSEGDDSVTWRQGAIRFAVSFVSAGLLGAGYFHAVFDPARRGWHDLASGTRLVRTCD